jgi:hypothetical protein
MRGDQAASDGQTQRPGSGVHSGGPRRLHHGTGQQGTGMKAFPRGYFTAPTGLVHFRRAGAPGGDPLLLLHQSPLSSVQFEAVLPGLLARGFDAVALDMPGFGMSDEARDGATLEPTTRPSSRRRWISSAGRRRTWSGITPARWWPPCSPRRAVAHRRLVLNGFPLLTQAERDHFATFYFGPKEPLADGSTCSPAGRTACVPRPGWTDLDLMHRYTVEGLYRGDELEGVPADHRR